MTPFFRMAFWKSKSPCMFWTPWLGKIRPMVMACYQTSMAALLLEGPTVHGIFYKPKCFPDVWHRSLGMLPPHKAGLLSFLGQLGVVTQWGFICGLFGWGLLPHLGANPVGTSWLRGLGGTRQLAPIEASVVLSLAIGESTSAEDSLVLLASQALASWDLVSPLGNVNNVFWFLFL